MFFCLLFVRLQMGHKDLLLLSLLIILFSHSLSCYSNLEGGPTIDCLDEASSYDKRAYPSYISTVDDNNSPIGHRPAGFIMEMLHQVDSPVLSNRVVNVEDFGAKGDGSTDDTEAFKKAWNKVCSSTASSVLMVPENKNYLLKPVTFSGPCRSYVTVMIKGTIEAPSDRSDWDEADRRHWILFQNIGNLVVSGGGTLNGNGEIWWKNSCKINKSLPCKDAPTALTFYSCNNLRVEKLASRNSQQIHVSFEQCTNVQASNLDINAPGNSPNTDGIHVADTKNIQITNCTIRTGDDCISIASGSQGVKAKNIVCGPGHGISIGSLGVGNSKAYVSDVMVDTASLDGTMNGVRIKTWQGGRGYARNIIFQNIVMRNVQNPIIIDQNYCDTKNPCPDIQKSAVEVSNVLYKNIKGTSASDVTVKFDCSKTIPCHGIVLQNINLVGNGGSPSKSLCNNAKWTKIGKVVPPPCV